MADNPPSTAPIKADGFQASAGDGNANSSNNRSRDDRGGSRGGGRGRGRGQGHRGRGNDRGRGRGGGRGGFGSHKDFGGRHKKADMGRGEYEREGGDRRNRRNDDKPKKEGDVDDYHATVFSKEEIEAEGRKPKRKVAVLIGYAGSGYKGMQINGTEKTIEGDIFKAFVAAGAIAKANADDPKKSTLVRCARTDKGVHAAGNVISLKLIVEDKDIVKKINDALPPQIRVWGYERTNGSFSCYQSCDSRWYEYLIPTYSFLPPQPESFLGKKLVESAEKVGKLDELKSRQEDVANFWEEAHEKYIKPILEELDPSIREEVMAAIHAPEVVTDLDEPRKKKEKAANFKKQNGSTEPPIDGGAILDNVHGDRKAFLERAMAQDQRKRKAAEELSSDMQPPQKVQALSGDADSAEVGVTSNKALVSKVDDSLISTEAPDLIMDEIPVKEVQDTAQQKTDAEEPVIEGKVPDVAHQGTDTEAPAAAENQETHTEEPAAKVKVPLKKEAHRELTPVELAVKRVKAAYITAKKAYRIDDRRKKRVEEALGQYVGTRNYHNYTIQKTFSDPSAKRVIRSFQVGAEPVYINDTEWLSLKVHGQSFMMHQIRKMVAMAAMVVRCGSTLDVIQDSYSKATISIPKAPSLGLLLERPVFDSYNTRAVKEFEKEKIDFDKWKKQMDEFKQREIYDRIFREEEKDHQFHTFFHHIDHYKTDFFLWATAEGVSGARQSIARREHLPGDHYESDEEMPDAKGEEG